MKMRCIAIDDEPLALDVISEYCSKFSFIELVRTFDNGLDVIEFLKDNKIDVMFLDIQMEGLSGIQLLGVLQNRPKVILTTAYENYALKGYELDVTDYLLKPISFERFTLSVNKIYNGFTNRGDDVEKSPVPAKIESNINDEYIFIKVDTKLVKVGFDDVLYIEGQGDYLSVVTTKGKYLTLQNFANMQRALPHPDFLRVHKSYIVSFNKIDKIEKRSIYINNKNIPVSDTYKLELMKLVRVKEV